MYRCDERDFNVCRFDGPVAKYPFSDHNAPQFEQIIALCEDVNEFLSQDPKNVVAINCKAGKDLLKEEETIMEYNWKGINEALTSTCQDILCRMKHHYEEWISIETLDKIKERKNKKTAISNSRTRAENIQAQTEYIEVKKQVKNSIKADKQKYVVEIATMAEKATTEV
ncbi:unnamed protein product [Schistosoma mattheei]|uniref:Uncharacterized protein n=1 Tax=Schistosoma mattheei TaxID=31246 RepID=A0A3P7ZTH7_9TREM|nr:unnamed protein product [Schistosoma mattheei]